MKALIVVDMQKDFIDGALGTKEAEAIVPAVAARIQAARRDGEAILFTRDTHSRDYLNTQEGKNLPVAHCIYGTDGWRIDARLEVGDAAVIDKPAFGSLELAARVAAIPELESVELIGLCTDICVISNAIILKARLPETPVYVRADCCAGVTPESHENALNAMKMCQIGIL